MLKSSYGLLSLFKPIKTTLKLCLLLEKHTQTKYIIQNTIKVQKIQLETFCFYPWFN